jgi:uncharacterized protein YkwD
VGIEDRDWYRAKTEASRGRRKAISGFAILAAIVVGLVASGILKRQLEGPAAKYGAERKSYSSGTRVSVLPGLPDITIGGDSLYPKDDPWRTYLADDRTCPGGERSDAPAAAQAETMTCLVNYARKRRGLRPLVPMAVLDQAAVVKVERIVRCLDFNHNACGADPARDARVAGYQGSWGENLYIAGGKLGSPRVALDGWLNSEGHRKNLFRPEWRTQGVAVQKLESFGHDKNMTLWVNQFGVS